MICNAIMERLPSDPEAGSQKRRSQTHLDRNRVRMALLSRYLKAAHQDAEPLPELSA